MSVVGGLDIHRKQITFDYLDVDSGQLWRGQIAPADRAHLAAWLRERFDPARHGLVELAVEACTGWRYVAEELARAGVVAHLGEPPAAGRLPQCWIPPAHVLECRALLETYHALRVEHTAWVQRVHAVLF